MSHEKEREKIRYTTERMGERGTCREREDLYLLGLAGVMVGAQLGDKVSAVLGRVHRQSLNEKDKYINHACKKSEGRRKQIF